MSIGPAAVAEGNSGTTDAVFPVTLSAATTVPVTVSYATGDGTATAGSDYTAVTASVTIAAGEHERDDRGGGAGRHGGGTG